jgi:hypothetical protein
MSSWVSQLVKGVCLYPWHPSFTNVILKYQCENPKPQEAKDIKEWLGGGIALLSILKLLLME